MLYPLLWMLASSFRTNGEILNNLSIIPEKPESTELYCRMERTQVFVRDVRLELAGYRGSDSGRQRDVVLDHRICFPPVLNFRGSQVLVRDHARDTHDAATCGADTAGT